MPCHKRGWILQFSAPEQNFVPRLTLPPGAAADRPVSTLRPRGPGWVGREQLGRLGTPEDTQEGPWGTTSPSRAPNTAASAPGGAHRGPAGSRAAMTRMLLACVPRLASSPAAARAPLSMAGSGDALRGPRPPRASSMFVD